MKAIFSYLKPYKWGLFLAALTTGISTFCELLLPMIMSSVLDNGISTGDFNQVQISCLQMLVVALLSVAATLLGAWLTARVVYGFCGDLRRGIFRKVNQMTFEEFGKMGAAALVTRATHDAETVSDMASQLIWTVITIPVLFGGGVALTMSKSLELGLVMLAVLPLIFGIVLLVCKRVLPIWEKSDDYIDKQNDLMRQRLRGIRVIRAFNAEGREHRKMADFIRQMSDSFVRGNIATGLVEPMALLLLNGAMVVMVWAGTVQLTEGASITGADLFAMVQYVGLTTSGVIYGAFALMHFPRVKVAVGRINQVLTAQSMADPVAYEKRSLSGAVRLDKVTFRYEGADEAALEDVDLQIRAGEKVAIIGGTGSGKSSIVSQILGFRTPTSGEVTFDGISAGTLSKKAIRENISAVLQNTTVYSGTIRENLFMGKADASEQELWAALEIAQATDFVRELPKGLDHEITQSGKNLSGGQKQRIGIARAVLKKASLYIFDDSFSALDFLTEARLRRGLAKTLQGASQLLITQRVTSAMHCDRIYVLDRGRVAGSGSHQELLESCSVYKEIYESQTGGGTV